MNIGNRNSKFNRFCFYLAAHRLAVVVLILITTMVFAYGASRIHGEVLLQEMLPYDHPYLKILNHFAKAFGSGGSTVAVAIKAKDGDIFKQSILTKLQKMTDEVQLWEEVYRVLTISMGSRGTKVVIPKGKGELAVKHLMWPDVPKTKDEMETLKYNIFSNPAYNGTLVARDGTAALLLTEFKENISYEQAFGLLQSIREAYTDEETSVHIVGFPMLMGWVYNLKSQMYFVFALSALLIVLTLFLIFRNIQGMIGPMANAIILTIWGLGFVGFMGINFNPLLYVLAFLVGARMVSNSVQITYRYFEELDGSRDDKDQACYETMRTMLIPNFAAVITDAAGFLVLLLAKIVLMQHLAVIMSFWMISIALTGVMVPVICTFIPLNVASEKWSKNSCQMDWQARAITILTRFSIGSGRFIVGGVIIGILVTCVWKISDIKIGDPTPGSPILYGTHVYNQDQEVINNSFDSSSENFVLYYEGKKGSVYDPEVIGTFEAFSRYMQKKLPDIYKSSSSLIDMTKMINLNMHDGDEAWNQLPIERPLLAALLDYVRGYVVDINTFARFMDNKYERSQITIYFADHTSDNLLRIRDAAYEFFEDHPMKIDKGEFVLAGGRIGMEIAVNEEMKRSHVMIDSIVLAAIFLLCTLSFRSITAGLMLTVPLVFANSIAFAYMAWANIGLSINTLPVAAVGVGVGVDFAIYLYSRCKEEYPLQEGDWSGTIIQAVCTSGKAVVYTGLTIILPVITWFFISEMKFQAEVGFFLAMIMATNVILTLTLHPLLICLVKPKFLSNVKTNKKVKKSELISKQHGKLLSA